jgi:hypothetical protein
MNDENLLFGQNWSAGKHAKPQSLPEASQARNESAQPMNRFSPVCSAMAAKHDREILVLG